MTLLAQIGGPVRDPLDALLAAPGEAALAVITGTEGPSYRPVGAMMAVLPGGACAGSLSSGCIEADIAAHARRALDSGKPVQVRYGQGSPFLDIRLPCGGGLDILIVPRPDRGVLEGMAAARAERRPVTLALDARTGAARVSEGQTGWDGDSFLVRQSPTLQFLVFGKGPEAATFAALVHSAGYPNTLLSPDDETLARAPGAAARPLARPRLPKGVAVDPWTAIVLFFHDHDWEPPILKDALETPAFYIGAQGSRRAREARDLELRAMGVDAAGLARLKGPIGLIPSARDPGTLAVSVLAEVLDTARGLPG